MANFIKLHWFKIGLLAILIVFIGGAFYWFQLRPTNIRKECYKNTYPDISDEISAIDKKYGMGSGYGEQNERDYERCLRSKGL